jgi:hypothetical protein
MFGEIARNAIEIRLKIGGCLPLLLVT